MTSYKCYKCVTLLLSIFCIIDEGSMKHLGEAADPSMLLTFCSIWQPCWAELPISTFSSFVLLQTQMSLATSTLGTAQRHLVLSIYFRGRHKTVLLFCISVHRGSCWPHSLPANFHSRSGWMDGMIGWKEKLRIAQDHCKSHAWVQAFLPTAFGDTLNITEHPQVPLVLIVEKKFL